MSKIIKICPICKKEFESYRIKNRIFCSNKCSAKSIGRYESIKNYYLQKYGKEYQFGKIEITCNECGKKVKKYKDHLIPKFCSRKCWIEYLKKHPRLPCLLGDKSYGFKKGNTYWRKAKSKYKKGWIKLGNNKYWYDSSFEKEAMKIMYDNKIKFIRDYKVDLNNSIMFIDFYLPKYDKFIEAKGYMRKDSENKIKLFEKLYNKKIDVIQAQYTKDFCIKFINYMNKIKEKK